MPFVQDVPVGAMIRSVEDLRELRMSNMERFLSDFEHGKQAGRHVDAELPTLLFSDGEFDLALCSHFLFLYTDQFSQGLPHRCNPQDVQGSAEARVFPLLALGGAPSRRVQAVSERLRQAGHAVSIESVPYEFERGGNQMMRINRR